MKEFSITDREIDEYVFNELVASGYAPGIDEVQAITDIFMSMMYNFGILYIPEEEGTDGI